MFWKLNFSRWGHPSGKRKKEKIIFKKNIEKKI